MTVFQYISLSIEAQQMLDSGLPADVKCTIVNRNDTDKQQFEQFMGCEVAFGNIPAAWVANSSELKWLQLESVGYEPYLEILPEFQKRGTITNLHGFFGQPVAESALAGILSLKRGIDKLTILKGQKKWKGSALRPELTLLSGTKALVAGGGNIGQSIKKLLSGFDTKTVVYDKLPEAGDIHNPEEFDRELPDADIVISCLPETVETRHFFNERRFCLMRPSTIFANVGRGGVVDEAILIRWLYEKRIAGAVLDVTLVEPLPQEHPLWDCPDTIITQHTGGGTEKELTGKVEMFLDNLVRYMDRKPLERTVTA